jgi:hypothetical protein
MTAGLIAALRRSTRQTSPGAGRAIFSFHRIKNREMLISAFIAVPEKLGFCFQIKDRPSQPAAFGERQFWEFCYYLGGTH